MLPRVFTNLSIFILLEFVSGHAAQADEQRLSSIPPGTVVETTDAERWNRVVLISQPQLTAGDVDAVVSSVREVAATLWLTIMATVEKREEAGKTTWRLLEFGVGTSTEVEGKLHVITRDNASELGISLGLIKRQQLMENERQFQELKVIARTSSLVIFDAPAIVHRQGTHVDRVMRHLFWIDARTGSQGMLVWFLEDQQGQLVPSNEPARWLSAQTSEQRVVHIDRSEFNFLGIPGSRAFALVDLPPGKDVGWTSNTRAIAALPSYSMEQLRLLSDAFNKALAATQVDD